MKKDLSIVRVELDPENSPYMWQTILEESIILCFLYAMFLRSLRPTCHLCKINCSRKQSIWLSLSHAARIRRMCSGQKLQTHSQQKNTKFLYKPLCCLSTTNPVCKERGRRPGRDENEESIINQLAESQDEGKEYVNMASLKLSWFGILHFWSVVLSVRILNRWKLALFLSPEADALHETDEYKQVLQEEFHYDGVHHSLMIIHPGSIIS